MTKFKVSLTNEDGAPWQMIKLRNDKYLPGGRNGSKRNKQTKMRYENKSEVIDCYKLGRKI